MPWHWSPLDNHIHATQGSKPSPFHYSLLIRPDKGVKAMWFYYVVIWIPYEIPTGRYHGENCLNSPSGYSLAFIISDGFKIVANILFLTTGGVRVLSVIHTNGPLKPPQSSVRGWGSGGAFGVPNVQVHAGTVRKEREEDN